MPRRSPSILKTPLLLLLLLLLFSLHDLQPGINNSLLLIMDSYVQVSASNKDLNVNQNQIIVIVTTGRHFGHLATCSHVQPVARLLAIMWKSVGNCRRLLPPAEWTPLISGNRLKESPAEGADPEPRSCISRKKGSSFSRPKRQEGQAESGLPWEKGRSFRPAVSVSSLTG